MRERLFSTGFVNPALAIHAHQDDEHLGGKFLSGLAWSNPHYYPGFTTINFGFTINSRSDRCRWVLHELKTLSYWAHRKGLEDPSFVVDI
jgi:hypothetical protein